MTAIQPNNPNNLYYSLDNKEEAPLQRFSFGVPENAHAYGKRSGNRENLHKRFARDFSKYFDNTWSSHARREVPHALRDCSGETFSLICCSFLLANRP